MVARCWDGDPKRRPEISLAVDYVEAIFEVLWKMLPQEENEEIYASLFEENEEVQDEYQEFNRAETGTSNRNSFVRRSNTGLLFPGLRDRLPRRLSVNVKDTRAALSRLSFSKFAIERGACGGT